MSSPRSYNQIAEAVIDSPELRDYVSSGGKKAVTINFPDLGPPSFRFNAEHKATVLTSTGPFTSYERPPGVIDLPQQRLTVADLIPSIPTTASSVRYWAEDSYTNAATTVAEDGLKPESSFDLSEVDAPIRKVAVLARISDELIEDFPALQAYIEQRLRFMVAEREEAQILNGNGAGTNLTGILQTSGIQTQAVGADNGVIAIHKAITKVRATGHMEPDGVVVHPNDWQEMKLTRDAQDQFYAGGPFFAPYGGSPYSPTQSIWSLPAIVTTAISEGTALVGSFAMGASIFRRKGATLTITNTDGEDFRYNRSCLRMESRLALGAWRPLAFSTVTGL